MQNVLIIVQLCVSIALVATVLLQRSEGGALGMGGGGSGLGGLFSPRGAADTLTRTTAILAALFFITSLALTLLALHGRPEPTSILDQQQVPGKIQPFTVPGHAPQPAKPAPKVPAPHS
jgi:preprotein translocase subunit SecG